MAKLYKDYLGESYTGAEHTIPHRAKFAHTCFLSKWQNYILQQASSACEAQGAVVQLWLPQSLCFTVQFVPACAQQSDLGSYLSAHLPGPSFSTTQFLLF